MFKTGYFTIYIALLAMAVAMAAGRTDAADSKSSAEDPQRLLIGVLQSDAPPADKAITCKRLAVYGTGDAVPALAPLLADEQLASWARIALEAIPDPAAGAALREAMAKLQGRLLIDARSSSTTRPAGPAARERPAPPSGPRRRRRPTARPTTPSGSMTGSSASSKPRS